MSAWTYIVAECTDVGVPLEDIELALKEIQQVQRYKDARLLRAWAEELPNEPTCNAIRHILIEGAQRIEKNDG